MLAIIDTQEFDADHMAADISKPAVQRLAAGAAEVYVATNPEASAVYVGTAEEMTEMFEDNLSNLVPVAKFETFGVEHVPWKLGHN